MNRALPSLLLSILLALVAQAAATPPQAFRFAPNDTVALVGGANIERTRFNGFLQTHLVAADPGAKIRVRNFGWEGDTVFEQWRDDGNVERLDARRAEAERRNQAATGSTSWRQQRDWRQQLGDAGATIVLAQFGQMESLNGVARLPQFIAAYERLIAEFADAGRRVVLVAPVAFEKSSAPKGPDLSARNGDLRAYQDAIRELAAKLGLLFIPIDREGRDGGALTENGFQLSEEGHRVVARAIAVGLGIAPKPEAETAAVRREVVEMERLWFDYWRPMNWAFLTGDRTNVPYSKDWKDASKRIFPEEMNDFLPLLKQAEENVWAALAGQPTTPIGVRSSIPVEAPSVKPQSPEEELASFTILDGFAVNLFASEADGVVKPIQMRWDERGRLWVACAVSYPQIKPGEKANDYVLVCEDTDGDGRADKFHKFVEGLFMPSGLELGDGGLYVAQGTELLHFRDTDGGDRADTRRILLGGFGTADSHQMINCINWGFGGELWFTQGHHIYSRVETPYGVETLNRAGVWRLRPRTGHLDPFFQWSSAGANCWGVVTTDYGQPFHKSGANIGAYFSTPGLVRSNLAVNAQPMNLFLARIKQVGLEFVGSSHFPPEMQGRAIIGGYYGNTLEQHELKLVGGVYSSTQLPNIIETKNNVFRPVEVRSGPDGGLYVADWYNPIIGHYQASYRHPDRDKAHGRIWRVTAKDRPLAKVAPLAKMGVAELLEQLDSPERWAKYQAKRLLFAQPTAEVVAALDAWVPRQTDDYRRLQALALYEAHEAPRPELLKSLLRAKDVRIRAYATRTLSTWARDGALPDALALLEPQIADEDPLVRLEAIVAASYVPDARAAALAARALDQPFNAYHQHALTKTLHATNPQWSGLLAAGQFDFEKDEHLIFALQNGWVENNPTDLRNLSGTAVDYQPNAASNQVMAIMQQQVDRQAGNAARQRVWLKALAAVAGASELPFILERGGNDPAILEALADSAPLKRARPADAAKWLAPIIDGSNAELQSRAIRLAGLWKLTDFAPRIREIAFDEKSALPLRKTALAAIGDPKELLRVLDDTSASSLHGTALEALVAANANVAATFILRRLNAYQTPQDAVPMFQALLARAEGGAALKRALERPDAIPASSARLALQSLNFIGRADPKLSSKLMALAGLNSALPVYTKEYVEGIVQRARTDGDAVEGRKVYEQASCFACHAIGGEGGKIGPDLSAISRGMPIDMIVAEVVWPALNVKEGYEAATATMKDGTVITGFKHTDTADSIAIREMATGEVKTIKRADTKQIQTGGTVMPDGLTATLNERQLAHLVKYLSELGK